MRHQLTSKGRPQSEQTFSTRQRAPAPRISYAEPIFPDSLRGLSLTLGSSCALLRTQEPQFVLCGLSIIGSLPKRSRCSVIFVASSSCPGRLLYAPASVQRRSSAGSTKRDV